MESHKIHVPNHQPGIMSSQPHRQVTAPFYRPCRQMWSPLDPRRSSRGTLKCMAPAAPSAGHWDPGIWLRKFDENTAEIIYCHISPVMSYLWKGGLLWISMDHCTNKKYNMSRVFKWIIGKNCLGTWQVWKSTSLHLVVSSPYQMVDRQPS